MTTYRSRPTKRRSKADIDALCEQLYLIVSNHHPMTVRQVFYQAVSRGLIEKSEREYKNVVVRLLGRLRMEKVIPFGWISDSTRWQRKPDSFSSLENLLRNCARTYRKSLWDQTDVYVEVWTEKDAIAGILYQETGHWDVPLMVSRGFSSHSYLYEAVQAMEGKQSYLYYFGDHDPSGVFIDQDIERRLHEMARLSDLDVEIHFERVAVTPEQIYAYNLPTRPTKKSDSRSKGFQGESVEVDAFSPEQLREIARSAIAQHIDFQHLDQLRQVELEESRILDYFASKVNEWRDQDQS